MKTAYASCSACAPHANAVSPVVEEVGLFQPLVSHHLKGLRKAGLVSVERSAPLILYQAIAPAVKDVLADLAELVVKTVALAQG